MNQQELEMEMPPSQGAGEKQEMNVVALVFQNAQVRTLSQGGEPWFVLTDVCGALGIANSRNVFDRLDEDQRGVRQVDTNAGLRSVQIVNESGLYDVIIRSDKPEAKAFRKWVTSEVLPTIRKTGAYVTPSRGDIHLAKLKTQFEGAIGIAKLLGMTGNQGILSAANVIEEHFGVNPVRMFKAELKAPSKNRLMTPTQIGQELEALSGRKHSARMINETLRELGFQVKTAAGWEATETAKAEGIAVLQDTGKKHSSGVPVQQLKWDRSILEQLKGGLK